MEKLEIALHAKLKISFHSVEPGSGEWENVVPGNSMIYWNVRS